MSEAGKYTCLLSFNFFFLFHEASLHYTSLLYYDERFSLTID